MVSREKLQQYRGKAAGWSDREYADVRAYLERRADLVVGLGPRPAPGDVVLDFACGDGGLGAVLEARGYRYHGVDVTEEMAAAARDRLGPGSTVSVGDLNLFTPETAVAVTTVFRALYYATDRRAFFARVRGYTTGKLVFDLNPRQYAVPEVVAELRAAGWQHVELRPFFVPQTKALPAALRLLAAGAERVGPIARLVLRRRFTYIVAAS